MKTLLAVFIGGGIGSLTRYGIAKLVTSFYTFSFPLATFISNVISCIILSLFIVYIYNRNMQHDLLKIFVLVGICGGLSTFSTFSYETLQLFKSGYFLVAILNIILSVAVCIALMYYLLRSIE